MTEIMAPLARSILTTLSIPLVQARCNVVDPAKKINHS